GAGPRSRQDLDPRGARPGAVRGAGLRAGGERVRGRDRPCADQRLRAVLPRPLAADARSSRRGSQAAGAGGVYEAVPARLPDLPRPRQGAGGSGLIWVVAPTLGTESVLT